jgi:hypothetical protein
MAQPALCWGLSRVGGPELLRGVLPRHRISLEFQISHLTCFRSVEYRVKESPDATKLEKDKRGVRSIHPRE